MFEREHIYDNSLLDLWHPLEKAQYPYYFERREQLKKEYIFMCNLDGTTTITSDEKKKEKFISSNEDLEMEDGEINDDDDCMAVNKTFK